MAVSKQILIINHKKGHRRCLADIFTYNFRRLINMLDKQAFKKFLQVRALLFSPKKKLLNRYICFLSHAFFPFPKYTP